ncbi:MAG: transcriptional regulator, partial [Ruthenibacterium sp.]
IVESRQEGKWTHYKISEQGSKEALLLLRAITTPHAAAKNLKDGNG